MQHVHQRIVKFNTFGIRSVNVSIDDGCGRRLSTNLYQTWHGMCSISLSLEQTDCFNMPEGEASFDVTGNCLYRVGMPDICNLKMSTRVFYLLIQIMGSAYKPFRV